MMKITGNSVIAAALVGIAIVLGSWLGSAATTVSADAVAAKQGSDVTENQGPPIPLPRAIRSVSPPLSQQDVAAAAAKGTSQQQGSSSPEIVPGGPPPASAIERLWETNANQGWKVRATPLTRPNWYITGVVQRGDKTQVIILAHLSEQNNNQKLALDNVKNNISTDIQIMVATQNDNTELIEV